MAGTMDDQIDDEMTARFCLALGPLYPPGRVHARAIVFREGPEMLRFVLQDFRGPEGSCGYTLRQRYASRAMLEQAAFDMVGMIARDLKDLADRESHLPPGVMP